MLVPIPLDQMVPLPELFRHRSTLHGQAHVSRVMVHAMRLIDATDGVIATGPAHFEELLVVATRLS